MPEKHIEVSGLRKMYGDFAAVDSLDLEVEAGEVFALLGPNGAGKTTSVEIMVGVRPRTSGEVRILGQDPAEDRREWRDRVGVVPQHTGEYLELTVREVIEHFAAFYSDPLGVEELIAMVGLTEKTNARSTSLSGGQKRRLDVAVGVVGRPDIIFLDEPTTGLDPVARREAWDLVEYFRTMGTTTILTTHYLDEAEQLADRAGVIARGKMVALGTIPELRNGGVEGGVHVTFDPTGHTAPALPADLAESLRNGADGGPAGVQTLVTTRPTALARELTNWAQAQGLDEVPGLTITRPSLEDAYLRLIQEQASVAPSSQANAESSPAEDAR